MLWRDLLGRVRFDLELSLIDSSPVPVCRFGRAYRCRRLAEESTFGFDEMSKQTFENFLYGVLRQCRAVMHHCGSMKAYSLDLTQKKMVAASLEGEMPGGEMFA